MKKILVFGGTFNPVHNGHIYNCRTIADKIGADEVHIIPTYSPVHKDVDSLLESCQHRLNMCKLAFDRDNEYINPIEIEKRRPCYSYETLTWLSEQNPNSQLYLACGSDMFLSIDTWRNPKILFEKAIVCAISRQDNYDVLKDYAKKQSKNGLNCIIVEAQPMVMSSSQIRLSIKSGDFSGLPQKVADYIKKENLYV